jgi:nucleoside-diphosphate-sugar epimerase
LSDQMARWRWTRGYVENIAAAIALAVTDPRASGRVYNLGEASALSTVDWVRAIAETAGWYGQIITAPDYQLPEEMKSRAGMDQKLVTDTSRFRTELGYEPPVSHEEGLIRTVAWERAHPPDPIDSAQFDYATEDVIITRLTS